MAEETTEVAQTLPSLDVELTQNEIKGQIEGYEYLIDVAKTQPEEYQKIFGGLPPEAKNFIRFLKERAQIKNNPIEKIDPGTSLLPSHSSSVPFVVVFCLPFPLLVTHPPHSLLLLVLPFIAFYCFL
eukprot:TRINITY_DN512_c0_g1_i2.p3 TRINITY_DN512_c0_g1~~TRINITY_DN512_c0_g1_i2.p3  ORF type:complete len:127 (+),score=46.17 TRINITY_DN512_c0_g1_i2:567-947(+)